MKMGNETRRGHVLSSGLKPIHTTRWPLFSPAATSGADGESTSGASHDGGLTASDLDTCTLSKLTKRSSGWVLFQSTISGPSIEPLGRNQLVDCV